MFECVVSFDRKKEHKRHGVNWGNVIDLQTLMNIDKGMIDLNGQKQFQQN